MRNSFFAEILSSMKKVLSLALLGGCLLLGNTPPPKAQAQSEAKRPNFILIEGEGHGWSSLPFAQDPKTPSAKNTNVRMPHFEALAQGGMRFAQFYAASPRCTPSRAALLTGKSPAQLHMTFVNEGKRDADVGNTKLRAPQTSTELSERETTIAELLQTEGYATAHFGKWHVGRANPSRHGFPVNDGPNNNGGPDNSADPSTEQTPLTGQKSVAFVTEQLKAGKPFYLQLDQYASKEDKAQEDMDKVLGELMQVLKAQNAESNTYILYTTDHGTPGRNFPLRGGKGHVLEGGIRVPLLVKGPGIAANAVSNVPATGVDLFPTLASLAGIKTLPTGIEGGSLLPVLKSGGTGAVKRSREGLFFHFPHYDFDNGGPASAIVLGNGKLVKFYETGSVQLYDIAKDPGERNDLAESQPERRADLEKRLTDYLKEINAQFATVNLSYDPSKPVETNSKRGGRKKGPGGGGGR
jgi:arylsulfatase A-like enzyme